MVWVLQQVDHVRRERMNPESLTIQALIRTSSLGVEMTRLEEALEILHSLEPVDRALVCEAGTKRGRAYLRVSSDIEQRWAVVNTPGDRWFALDVNGGFSLEQFVEGLDGAETRELLEAYVAWAQRYVLHGPSAVRTVMRSRRIELSDGRDTVELRKSTIAEIRDVFRRRGRIPSSSA